MTLILDNTAAVGMVSGVHTHEAIGDWLFHKIGEDFTPHLN